MLSINDLPTPTSVTGSCLCKALSYQIDFPLDHDFEGSSGTCQCTQCRKNVSGLFFMYHKVPKAAFKWLDATNDTNKKHDGTGGVSGDFFIEPEALQKYQASEGHTRGFCAKCGSALYWSRDAGPNVSVAIGTVDPLYLFGEGAGVGDGPARIVPKGGFGLVLASGGGGHEWIRNEIPGVTDKLSILGFTRGERCVSETDE